MNFENDNICTLKGSDTCLQYLAANTKFSITQRNDYMLDLGMTLYRPPLKPTQWLNARSWYDIIPTTTQTNAMIKC